MLRYISQALGAPARQLLRGFSQLCHCEQNGLTVPYVFYVVLIQNIIRDAEQHLTVDKTVSENVPVDSEGLGTNQ